ncbi:MAG: hypothetical protein ACREXW_01040 [Gammaproteobacteria bacterium]
MPITRSLSHRGSRSFRETVSSGATSEAVAVHPDAVPISVGLSPAGGATGLVEYTLSGEAAVNSGTATWRAWTHGPSTTAKDTVLTGPITALRCTATAGAVTWEIVA